MGSRTTTKYTLLNNKALEIDLDPSRALDPLTYWSKKLEEASGLWLQDGVAVFIFCYLTNSVSLTLLQSNESVVVQSFVQAFIGLLVTAGLAYAFETTVPDPMIRIHQFFYVAFTGRFKVSADRILHFLNLLVILSVGVASSVFSGWVIKQRSGDYGAIGLPVQPVKATWNEIMITEGIASFVYAFLYYGYAMRGLGGNDCTKIKEAQKSFITDDEHSRTDVLRAEDCHIDSHISWLAKGFAYGSAVLVSYPISGGIVNLYRLVGPTVIGGNHTGTSAITTGVVVGYTVASFLHIFIYKMKKDYNWGRILSMKP